MAQPQRYPPEPEDPNHPLNVVGQPKFQPYRNQFPGGQNYNPMGQVASNAGPMRFQGPMPSFNAQASADLARFAPGGAMNRDPTGVAGSSVAQQMIAQQKDYQQSSAQEGQQWATRMALKHGAAFPPPATGPMMAGGQAQPPAGGIAGLPAPPGGQGISPMPSRASTIARIGAPAPAGPGMMSVPPAGPRPPVTLATPIKSPAPRFRPHYQQTSPAAMQGFSSPNVMMGGIVPPNIPAPPRLGGGFADMIPELRQQAGMEMEQLAAKTQAMKREAAIGPAERSVYERQSSQGALPQDQFAQALAAAKVMDQAGGGGVPQQAGGPTPLPAAQAAVGAAGLGGAVSGAKTPREARAVAESAGHLPGSPMAGNIAAQFRAERPDATAEYPSLPMPGYPTGSWAATFEKLFPFPGLLPGGRDDQIRNAQFMGTSPGQPPPFNPDVEFSGLPHAFLSQPSSMGQGQPGLPPQAPAMANREPWRKRPYSGGFDTDLLMHYLGMR